MPCTKCKDGKYKWGNTGDCKYDTKEACEKANPKKYNKMNPTPLGKKTYEEYAKELKEFNLSKVEKVELALVDDLKDLIKRGLSIEKKLAGQITSYNGLLRAGGEFKKQYSNLVKAAKELGVDVPNELKKLEEIADGFEKKGEALKKVSNLFG